MLLSSFLITCKPLGVSMEICMTCFLEWLIYVSFCLTISRSSQTRRFWSPRAAVKSGYLATLSAACGVKALVEKYHSSWLTAHRCFVGRFCLHLFSSYNVYSSISFAIINWSMLMLFVYVRPYLEISLLIFHLQSSCLNAFKSQLIQMFPKTGLFFSVCPSTRFIVHQCQDIYVWASLSVIF